MSARLLAPPLILLLTTGCWPFIWELQQTDATWHGDSGLFGEAWIEVHSPFDEQAFEAGDNIYFEAAFDAPGFDFVDIRWFSSLDGEFLQGEQGYATLNPGRHEILATFDAGAHSPSYTLNIEVGEAIPPAPIASIDLLHMALHVSYEGPTVEHQEFCQREDCGCKATATGADLIVTEFSENQLTFWGPTAVSVGDCDPAELGIWYPTSGNAYHTLNSSNGFETINSWVMHQSSEPETLGATPEQLGLLMLGTDFCPECSTMERHIETPTASPSSLPGTLSVDLSANWDGYQSAVSYPPSDHGDLLITEIMFHSNDLPGDQGQWIELYNPTSNNFALHGCEIGNGPGQTIVPGVAFIGAGESLTLAAHNYPNFNPDIEWGTLPLAAFPGGITLMCRDLTDPNSFNSIDQVIWLDASWSLPNQASLQLDGNSYDATVNDSAGAWCPSELAFGPSDRGTPGTVNPTCP